MHRQLIDEFGGIHGLRDRGLLEAAIFRPQNGYYDDLIHEAAALMESLANNHAFLDGNKRISLAATDTFLRVNGHYLELETIAAHKFITESITKREFRVRQIREWLIAHVQPVEEE
jgi:death-on-curing protein